MKPNTSAFLVRVGKSCIVAALGFAFIRFIAHRDPKAEEYAVLVACSLWRARDEQDPGQPNL